MSAQARGHEPSLYDAIGGEAGVRRLTRRMYELMDTLPEAAACRAIHPPSLSGSEQKLFEFLSGWLGGPPLFVEKHGPPMLRRRHFVAAIGPAERDGWIACFEGAMAETVDSLALRAALREPVLRMAFHMQNRE
ncbi:MAG: group II truncated hemoglobin [Hyphomicrobiaceae bacterium]